MTGPFLVIIESSIVLNLLKVKHIYVVSLCHSLPGVAALSSVKVCADDSVIAILLMRNLKLREM